MELRSTVGLWVTVRRDGRTGDPIERLRHPARDVSPAVWFGGSGPSKLGVNEWRVTSGESQEEENLDSRSQFCEQAGEVARGDDVSGLVTGQREQAAFVAGDEVIRVAGLCQRQQEVVARVG